MTLDAYLAQPGAKSLTALALEVGVSKGRLSQLRLQTRWPPALALRVEEATSNVVDAASLSDVVAQVRNEIAA